MILEIDKGVHRPWFGAVFCSVAGRVLLVYSLYKLKFRALVSSDGVEGYAYLYRYVPKPISVLYVPKPISVLYVHLFLISTSIFVSVSIPISEYETLSESTVSLLITVFVSTSISVHTGICISISYILYL